MADAGTENTWPNGLILQMGNPGPERRKDLPRIVTQDLALWLLFPYLPPEPMSARETVLAGFTLVPGK